MGRFGSKEMGHVEVGMCHGYATIQTSSVERARSQQPREEEGSEELCGLVRVNLVCLQETKMDVMDQFTVMQCLGPSFDGFSYLPAEETRGGSLSRGTPRLCGWIT